MQYKTEEILPATFVPGDVYGFGHYSNWSSTGCASLGNRRALAPSSTCEYVQRSGGGAHGGGRLVGTRPADMGDGCHGRDSQKVGQRLG